MKINFSNVTFSNNFTASLDGLEAWAYDWVLYESPQQALIMRHQSGRSNRR